MNSLLFAIIIVAALILGLALAFVPLKVLIDGVSRKVAEPIRQFIKRQRDRRRIARGTPDRRENP